MPIGLRIDHQPGEQGFYGQLNARAKAGHGQYHLGLVKKAGRLVGLIDENAGFFRVDHPAHGGAVGEAMEDIANDLSDAEKS
jgi:hypothetical protein